MTDEKQTPEDTPSRKLPLDTLAVVLALVLALLVRFHVVRVIPW